MATSSRLRRCCARSRRRRRKAARRAGHESARWPGAPAPRRGMLPLVDYDSVASVYLKAPDQPNEAVVLPSSPARRLRDALEPIATHGWWCRPTNERMARLGLGFLEGYVRGRAASLGEA